VACDAVWTRQRLPPALGMSPGMEPMPTAGATDEAPDLEVDMRMCSFTHCRGTLHLWERHLPLRRRRHTLYCRGIVRLRKSKPLNAGVSRGIVRLKKSKPLNAGVSRRHPRRQRRRKSGSTSPCQKQPTEEAWQQAYLKSTKMHL